MLASKNQPDELTTEQPRQFSEPDLVERLEQLESELRYAAMTALCLPDGDLTNKNPEIGNKIRVHLRHLLGTLARKGVQPNDQDLRVIGGNK